MKTIAVNLFRTLSDTFGETVLRHRGVLVVATQLTLIALANLTAFLLRFDGAIPPPYERLALQGLPFVLLVFGAGLWVFGIQRGLWRYVGLHDLGRIL